MLRTGTSRSLARGAALLVGALTMVLATGRAQLPPQADRGDWAGAQYIPQDRQLANLLERAQAQLSGPEEEVRRGLETVQRILDQAEDYFTDRRLGGSLRGVAEALLAGQPDAGRALYEQIYGVEARTLLQSATDSDAARLNDVIRRFLATQAGRDAALLKAATEMDRGRFLEAARLFERLWHVHRRSPPAGVDVWERAVTAYWKAGVPESAETLFLSRLSQNDGPVLWRGQTAPEFAAQGDALNWLREQLGDPGAEVDAAVADWLVPGGAADRNAAAAASSPIFDDAWSMPLLDDADAPSHERREELLMTVESVDALAAQEPQWRTYAVAEPVVVDRTVVFSSYGRIKAVDAQTGAFRWQAADADPAFEYLAQGSDTSPHRSLDETMLESLVAQRAWLDATAASLSSDRERVYQVFDCGLIAPQQSYNLPGSPPHPLSLPSFNRLRAYDLETEGKLLWEVGGPPGRVALPLAGTFFLGAPLPLDGALYVLGEERGQVRLIVLDPRSGELRWSTALLNTSVDVTVDLERRLAGLTPAERGGILVCPTGGGLLVAVDVVSRSLLWAAVYEEPKSARPTDVFGGRLQQFNDAGESPPSIDSLLTSPRWMGPGVVIAGSVVLHAPPGHPLLHCVGLLDGRRLWTRPRQRMISIAGVYGDQVVLIGERQVEAVQLESGETVWELPLGPPSGRPVREGRLLRLPLQGGELATVDLATGRLLARSATRFGAELGSLVAAGGRLVTQTASGVRGFRALEELRTQIETDLTAEADNPAALAVRGELALHAGQTGDALADLRTALAAADDHRVRGLIIGTLLEQLRDDFATHRSTIPELDRLTRDGDPDQRMRLLRLAAEGLEGEGDLLAAYDRYLELFALQGLSEQVEHVSDVQSVRLDRWVQGRLQQLDDRAPADLQPDLDVRRKSFVDAAVSDQDMERLRRATFGFAGRAAGQAARRAWSDLVDPLHEPLRAEALWLAERRDRTPGVRAAAIARLIRLYADHGRGEIVEALLGELDELDRQSVQLDGKPARETAAALRDSPPVAEALAAVTTWPTGSISVRPQQEGAPQQPQTSPLRVVGPTDPVTEPTVIHSDGRDEMVAYDGLGNPEWTDRMRVTLGYAFPDSHYVERRGHRALLFLDNQFRILDMLHYRRPPRTILEEALTETDAPDRLGRTINRLQRERMGLRTNWRRDQSTLRYLGLTGPLGDDVFCFQRGSVLFAVDPFQGDELWRLEDVPYGCEILADDRYVVLIPPVLRSDQQEARIYQAADGTLLGTRRLPPGFVRDRQGADWGRLFLTRTPHTGARDSTLAMYDPVLGENVWERIVPQYLTWAPLDGFHLVVLSESGILQLIDAGSGEVRFETQTELNGDVRSLTVVGAPREWFVFSECSPRENQPTQLLPPPFRSEVHAVNGPAYAFDRQTNETLWSRELFSLNVDPRLPGRWPLLVLSSEAQVVAGEGRRRVATKYQNLLLLNRRTGDVAFKGDGTGSWKGTAWSLSDEAPQLRLSFNGTALAVTFSADAAAEQSPQPPPPDDPAPANPPPPPTTQRRIPAPPSPTPADLQEN